MFGQNLAANYTLKDCEKKRNGKNQGRVQRITNPNQFLCCRVPGRSFFGLAVPDV